MRTLYAFGDSMLDCSHYTEHNVTPSTLLCENRDDLFPEFRGRDLASLGPYALAHRAVDGATLPRLEAQFPRRALTDRACAMLTIGGNDLLQGMLFASPREWDAWFVAYERALAQCPVRPLFVGNVYDPTFADPAAEAHFLAIGSAQELRARLCAFNQQLAQSAARAGAVVIDLHQRFLRGDPSWVTEVIEPSSTGASEIRRAFLQPVLEWACRA